MINLVCLEKSNLTDVLTTFKLFNNYFFAENELNSCPSSSCRKSEFRYFGEYIDSSIRTQKLLVIKQ